MKFTPDFLRAVVDALLPGLPPTDRAPILPAASQVGVDKRLAHHLNAHPNRRQFQIVLEAVVQQSTGIEGFVTADEAATSKILQAVEQMQGAAFKILLFTVSADYYETKPVLDAFAWRATPPQPLGYSLLPFNENLLAPVKQRQKLWRSTDQ